MNDYIVIATVGSTDYLTKIRSDTLYSAEHEILDLSFCGNHTCSVTSCTAYDSTTITSDCFPFIVFRSQPVSFYELRKIILTFNDFLQRNDQRNDERRN